MAHRLISEEEKALVYKKVSQRRRAGGKRVYNQKLLNATGYVIRANRVKQGLNQSEFAQKLGLYRPAYGYIENGRQNPTLSKLALIAGGLDMRLSDLLAEVEVYLASAPDENASSDNPSPDNNEAEFFQADEPEEAQAESEGNDVAENEEGDDEAENESEPTEERGMLSRFVRRGSRY